MKSAIVIPTYNRAAMLPDAIESALAQTRPATVIVIDDGSTDGTAEALARYSGRIVCLRQPNRERAAARNLGAHTAGDVDLIFFLDSDDVVTPLHVESIESLADADPDALFFATGLAMADEQLRVFGRYPWNAPGRIALARFLIGRETVSSIIAVRRQAFHAIGGFDEDRDLSGSEDWLLIARLLAAGPARRGRECTALIRTHDGNSMKNTSSMERSMTCSHRKFFGDPLSLPITRLDPTIEARSLARRYLLLANNAYSAGSTAGCREFLRKAVLVWSRIVVDPSCPWTLVRTLLGHRLSEGLRRQKRWLQLRLAGPRELGGIGRGSGSAATFPPE